MSIILNRNITSALKLLERNGHSPSVIFAMFLCLCLLPPISKSEKFNTPYEEFGITNNNIFLYYEDYEAATKFYDEILGFKLVLTIETARMYHIANTSYLTAVKGFADKHNLSRNKPVTFTLFTDQLDEWRSYLVENDIPVLAEKSVEQKMLEEGFVALDPGGYYLNFVRAKPHPGNVVLLTSLDKLGTVYVNPGGHHADRPQLGFKATMVSFYYEDLDSIHRFYNEDLGFVSIAEQQHAKTYQTSASGYFRVVDGSHGFHKPIIAKALKKGAMMSFFTDDTVKGWFEFAKKRNDIELRLPEMSDREELKAFSLNDHEGYSLEFDYFPEAGVNSALRKSIEDNSHLKIDYGHYSFDQPWRGTTKKEKMFFTLGMMNSYAESVSNKAKILGLGEPLSPEDTDELYEYAKMIAQRNKVKIYREEKLLETDLFPTSISKDKHVILIYIDDTLDKYLKIKADREKLVNTGKYTGEARKNIARRFGKLLSYKDDVIEKKLSRKLNAN